MIFSTEDPYPLFALDSIKDMDVVEIRRHAAAADDWLGLDTEEVERGIPRNLSERTGQELWQRIPVQTMLTPYVELRALLDHLDLPSGQTVVDLGAGYGRMGFVVGRHHPDLAFVGYEYVLDRVLAGRRALERFAYPNVRLETADLSSLVFKPCVADAYFIYDYGTRRSIEKTLVDLQQIARKRRITVIGRGRSVRDAIERQHPWLSQIVPPEHRPNFSIYQNR